MAGARCEVQVGSENSLKAIQQQLASLKLLLNEINTKSQVELAILIEKATRVKSAPSVRL